MPSWPSLGRANDHHLAQALRDGQPDAVAQLYDAYAARVYDYCHALLRDEALAAAALHDSFLAAHANIGVLSQPELLRSWLYALVRNECLRRLKSPETPAERREAPEADHAFLSTEEKDRREEARQLVHSALAGLTGRQREAVDLILRHDLDVDELASVLGVPADQTSELAAVARHRLDDALDAADLARGGECPVLRDIGWPLDPANCEAAINHVAGCPACAQHRQHEISTSAMLQTLPVAAMPGDLRPKVLTSASAPELAEERALIARNAGPFDEWGWPTSVDGGPADEPSRRGRHGATRLWPALAAAACVLLVVGGVFFLLPRSSDDSNKASDAQSKSPPVTPSDSLTLSPTPEESPTPKKTRTPTPTPEPSTTTPRPRPTTSRPVAGRLSVSGGGTILPGQTATAILRARGGPVRWSARPGAYLSVSPSSGRLGTGATGIAAITLRGWEEACAGGIDSGTVSFSPGGAVRVSWDCDDF